jgi:hypothetical protein
MSRRQRCRAAGLAKQATRANNIYKLFLAERKVSGVRAHSILRRASGIALPLYDDKLRKVWVSDAVAERLNRAYLGVISMDEPIDGAPSLSSMEMLDCGTENDDGTLQDDDGLLDYFDHGGILATRQEVWLEGPLRIRARLVGLSTWTIEDLNDPDMTFSFSWEGEMTQAVLALAWSCFRNGFFRGRRTWEPFPTDDESWQNGISADQVRRVSEEIQRSLRRSRRIE